MTPARHIYKQVSQQASDQVNDRVFNPVTDVLSPPAQSFRLTGRILEAIYSQTRVPISPGRLWLTVIFQAEEDCDNDPG